MSSEIEVVEEDGVDSDAVVVSADGRGEPEASLLTDENKLILYGLFKQATVGPVNTSRPGIFNPRDRYKWDAWKACEAKTKEEAMGDYITKMKQLLEEAA